MEHKHGRLRTMMMLAAVLLGFIGGAGRTSAGANGYAV